ncbi:MAG: SDR family NAD(P)-dependent oxidoreductase [Kordiimonadaceae bacterium]|nr:SDR family NAD(P)-dependent oxidoreductase [Kordiimonadaceae bacterium]
MVDKFDLKGRVALVTGAGGGLGRAHAIELATRGAKVVVNDLGSTLEGKTGSSVNADKVVAEIIALGGIAVANSGDVANKKDAKGMVDQAVDTYGSIDILVNNAGILRDKTFSKMTLEEFESVVNVHLMGSTYTTHAAWPLMLKQRFGRIIMTTSSSGLYGNFGQSNYGAAKMALVGLMNCLKHEGARSNVYVNCLAPTAWSRMTADLLPPEAAAFLTPESVSPAITFLSSDEAPNGVILEAGAGYFANVAIQEAQGIGLYLDSSAELLSEQWADVKNMQGARSFNSAEDVAGAIVLKYNAGL